MIGTTISHYRVVRHLGTGAMGAVYLAEDEALGRKVALNGKYDFFFATETSQEPLLELLGSAPNDKGRVVYDTPHTIPSTELIKERVEWMERYWGPSK